MKINIILNNNQKEKRVYNANASLGNSKQHT